MRLRVVTWHYNKPASAAAGSPRLTVHWGGQCHLVEGVVCQPRCWSVSRKRQPRCVMKALARDVEFAGGVAIILQ